MSSHERSPEDVARDQFAARLGLISLMDHPSPKVSLFASIAVLEMIHRGQMAQYQERVEALEAYTAHLPGAADGPEPRFLSFSERVARLERLTVKAGRASPQKR
jgi:hypothetical protein